MTVQPVSDQPAKTIMMVVGTRPEAVKVAPLVLALQAEPWCRPILVATGQHREMLHQTLEFFGVVPDHDLALQREGQTLTDLTARALTALTPVMATEAPDVVVVQGDTTSTFTGALAAFYAGINVAHLEAGLRTHNLLSPHPEEGNRRLTGVLAALHLAATPWAKQNLLVEGTDPGSIVVTGNTVIDALHLAVQRRTPYGDTSLEQLDAQGARVVLITSHRRESWGKPMERIGQAVAQLAAKHRDVNFVFPIHRNPVVRKAVMPAVEGIANVHIIEPLGYGAFTRLMNRSTVVLTDSGGVQEEAPSLGKPVLVMRETTERPEAVAAGCAMLVGTDIDLIVRETSDLLTDPALLAARSQVRNPYGDGRACERSVAALRHLLGVGPRADDFE
jgi:UDP-N-acetylglucosamine 2-epimerase (non-hydrolysing)